MYKEYQVISSSEAASLWGLNDSTLRRAISEGRLEAQKSGGTWLVETPNMVAAYGQPKPDTSQPTLSETFYIQDNDIPLLDMGRVPNKTGRHVLRTPDGEYIVVGGYWLRRPDEQWTDVLETA